jgi:hypothetical protein
MANITEDDLIIVISAAMARAMDGDREVNHACQRIAEVMAYTGNEITVTRSNGKLSEGAIRATREMLVRAIMGGRL